MLKTDEPTQQIRDFALGVVRSQSVADKLATPCLPLVDDAPGPALRIEAPGRSDDLAIRPAKEVKVPKIGGIGDRKQRARLIHALANHELQAVELFAWALLAFPEAPSAFRRGLLGILDDEQRHTRMYIARLEAGGARFGDFPVTGYFWGKVESILSPLHFVCAMSLTFENANLDHTLEYAEAVRRAGDSRTAAVIERVHRDEIEHVRFGWKWLQAFKDSDRSAWEAYREHLRWPLRPAKARGKTFHRSGREAAGLDADFIERLEESLT